MRRRLRLRRRRGGGDRRALRRSSRGFYRPGHSFHLQKEARLVLRGIVGSTQTGRIVPWWKKRCVVEVRVQSGGGKVNEAGEIERIKNGCPRGRKRSKDEDEGYE